MSDAIKNDLSRHDMARESLGLSFLDKPKTSKSAKPATKQPSAIAKKMNLTADQEAKILKNIRRL